MRPSAAELAFAGFQRVVAASCLIFGLFYWARLIGIEDGALWRFDLMPVHWQIASVGLAAFFPFASIGLWMLASWGPVIWFICAATETAMYLGMPERFGSRLPIVASHLAVLAFYCVLRAVLYRQRRSLAAQG